ncbi:type III secretion system protein [Burkholderia thailandensis]|nr:type III secretion system protein [Burkholderia thailandensis]AWY61948.1 type III secretion system protein [Burkholderia thailandensis]AWY63981.1 type III secretion system protein [Burkholderia thailandensis]NOK45675.1 type III secretion system protein [Burkholderia thailandensis]NOK57139.1 type III secretion system protein [Burkholderia thailandensis]
MRSRAARSEASRALRCARRGFGWARARGAARR